MKRVLVLYPAIAMFMLVYIGQIADSQLKADIQFELPRFKVNVSVSAEDEFTKSLIESHIKRELRSLKDVDVVPASEAFYFFRLVAIEGRYTTGVKTGSISIASSYFRRIQIPDFMLNPDHEEAWATLYANTIFTESSLFCQHYPTNELERACKNIVATFDQKQLEINRTLLDIVR